MEEAIEELRQLAAPTVDRASLERLLRVSPRQALRILHRLSPHRAGKSLLIARTDLIAKLESLARGAPVQAERRRLSRVTAELEALRRHGVARRLTLPVANAAGWEHLPEGIALAPGRLEIEFRSGDELLGKLLELARAVAADPEQFRAVIGGGPPP